MSIIHRLDRRRRAEGCQTLPPGDAFNETEEMAREVEAAFPNVVFGVAPLIPM